MLATTMNTVEDNIRALDQADAVERRCAETELIRLGMPALVAVTEALPKATLRQQIVMIKLLGRMGHIAALPTLRDAALDPQWLIRQAAIYALSNFPAEQVLPQIFHALYDHALMVRLEAIAALGRLRHSSAVATLLTHLGSASSEVETYTLIEALGLCASAAVIPMIEPYIHDENPQVRHRALEAISRLNGTTR